MICLTKQKKTCDLIFFLFIFTADKAVTLEVDVEVDVPQ